MNKITGICFGCLLTTWGVAAGFERGSNVADADEASAKLISLDELLSHMARDSENLPPALEISATSVLETYDDVTGMWQPTPESNETICTFETGLTGRTRLETTWTSGWLEGTSEYFTEEATLVYDGSKTLYAQHHAGPMEKVAPMRRGHIDPGRSHLLDQLSRAGTGVNFWMFLFEGYSSEAATLPAYWDEMRQQGLLTITSELFDGISTIKITCGDLDRVHFEDQFYLDPGRGYAIIGFRVLNKTSSGIDATYH